MLSVAAALMLATGTAHAGEGEGNPFPFTTPGLTTVINPAVPAQAGSAAYPDLAGYPAHVEKAVNSGLTPANGNEGAVQTANSLPPGFADGTVAHVQALLVRRHMPLPRSQPVEAARHPKAGSS